MKRLLAMILLVSVTISLFGCRENADLHEVRLESTNYNNIYELYGSFCADSNTIFYSSDGFYNQRVFVHQGQIDTKLFEGADFPSEWLNAEFWANDQSVYFCTVSDNRDERYIYQYDLTQNTYTKLLTAEKLADWMATGDHIAYELSTSDDYDRYDLYAHSIDGQESAFVCEDVWSFGIVNGSLRYLCATDTRELAYFEYDFDTQESKLLLSIHNSKHTRDTCFNYTNDYLIAFEHFESDEFTVYSMDGSSSVYTMPRTIQHFIAGDQYAFAVCYNTHENSTALIKHPDNDIYKIDLSDGEYEALDYSANYDTQLYVVSDDLIYILQNGMSFIGRSSTHVYLFDVSTHTLTKVLKY